MSVASAPKTAPAASSRFPRNEKTLRSLNRLRLRRVTFVAGARIAGASTRNHTPSSRSVHHGPSYGGSDPAKRGSRLKPDDGAVYQRAIIRRLSDRYAANSASATARLDDGERPSKPARPHGLAPSSITEGVGLTLPAGRKKRHPPFGVTLPRQMGRLRVNGVHESTPHYSPSVQDIKSRRPVPGKP